MNNIIYYNTIIQPKSGNFSLTILIMGALIIFLVFLLFGIMYSMKNTSISVTEKEIEIKSMFYGRKIPVENIDINGIRTLNLAENSSYAISHRRNGIALPGFHSGWMRLKNGEKALVFVTDKTNVALIPTNDYLLMFSMNNIEEFIGKLKTVR